MLIWKIEEKSIKKFKNNKTRNWINEAHKSFDGIVTNSIVDFWLGFILNPTKLAELDGETNMKNENEIMCSDNIQSANDWHCLGGSI